MADIQTTEPDAARFRRRLLILAAIVALGVGVLVARLVWLQAVSPASPSAQVRH